MRISPNTIAERYLAPWNETDPERRLALVHDVFAEGATYVDPLMHGDGPSGIDAMIAAAQQQFPGHRFAIQGTPEGFGDRVRFSWSLAVEGAAAVAYGTDIGVVGPDGRLESVTGFLDTPASTAPTETSTDGWSVDDFARFWAAPDIDLIGSGIAADAVAVWPGRTEPVRGRDAYVRPLLALLTRVPDLRLEVEDHATRGNRVFIRWTARGTDAGHPFEFEGVDIVSHEGGLVTGNRVFCEHPLIRSLAMV